MKKGKWIWYPGDREICMANEMLFRRDFRGVIEPPFWKIDSPYCNVFFIKDVSLAKEANVKLYSKAMTSLAAEGKGFLYADKNNVYRLPAGEYRLTITAYMPDRSAPIIRLDGDIITDESWEVQIDRYRGETVRVGYSARSPYKNLFRKEKVFPAAKELAEDGTLYDFGREIFGYLCIHDAACDCTVTACYGESKEEALSVKECETLDVFALRAGKTSVCRHSRGFRYVFIRGEENWGKVSVNYEFIPFERKGDFCCSDAVVNQIYDVAYHTFHLCSRETFLDGLKRDRWYWGGDAYQSFLYNYYTFFDRDINERTLWALRGKDPVTLHVNHIMDYTFYWFISLADYLLYMGETDFLKSIWPRAIGMMEYCLALADENGFIAGRDVKDWVFLDWAPMDNRGIVCAEQLLFVQALRSMAKIAEQFCDGERATLYGAAAEKLLRNTIERFYDKEKGVFWHNCIDGKVQKNVTRYASIFAVNYKLLDDKECAHTIRSVLKNDSVSKIVTPYAKFYELVSLCEAGELEYVCKLLEDYWGGMLQQGATSFWELYDQSAANHYEMYGRPFGKSLCHAWGSCPLFLLGRYFLGVVPISAGYSSFRVQPQLGTFQFIKGTVPTPKGNIKVYCDESEIIVTNDTSVQGELIAGDRIYPLFPKQELRVKNDS